MNTVYILVVILNCLFNTIQNCQQYCFCSLDTKSISCGNIDILNEEHFSLEEKQATKYLRLQNIQVTLDFPSFLPNLELVFIKNSLIVCPKFQHKFIIFGKCLEDSIITNTEHTTTATINNQGFINDSMEISTMAKDITSAQKINSTTESITPQQIKTIPTTTINNQGFTNNTMEIITMTNITTIAQLNSTTEVITTQTNITEVFKEEFYIPTIIIPREDPTTEEFTTNRQQINTMNITQQVNTTKEITQKTNTSEDFKSITTNRTRSNNITPTVEFTTNTQQTNTSKDIIEQTNTPRDFKTTTRNVASSTTQRFTTNTLQTNITVGSASDTLQYTSKKVLYLILIPSFILISGIVYFIIYLRKIRNRRNINQHLAMTSVVNEHYHF